MFGRSNSNNSFGNHICGVFYNSGPKRLYLPQVELKSHTTVNPVCYTTLLRQTFTNPNNEALPTVRYTFPLYDSVAVSSYCIRYDDKVLRGVVKQKDAAKHTYQAAVDRGETAALLESLPAGIFAVTLGNVPANHNVDVEITYCGEMKHDAAIDGLRYMLPTRIAPRYGDYPGELLAANTTAKRGISITIDVDMALSAIRKVQSPSHPTAVSMGAISTTASDNKASFRPSQASATLSLGTTELGGDFILQLQVDNIGNPQAIVEQHPTLPFQRAIMTTLVPKFELESGNPEIVFIADQSGSMGGSKNAALVSALQIFLKSLPFGVRFNICAFGSNFEFLWPQSQAYSEGNVIKAMAFVNDFSANYGGTEILKPITAAFEQKLKDMPLEIMLLSDGEVWAENPLFAFINDQIRNKGVDARVFTLGIGDDVSHTLIEGIARAGNGFAQFITKNEETDQKIIRMLKGALYAHTTDYELEVHYGENKDDSQEDDDFEIVEKVADCLKTNEIPSTRDSAKATSTKATSFFDTASESMDLTKGSKSGDRYAHLPYIATPKMLQAPATIPPLFPFNRSTVYLLLGPDSVLKPVKSLTLRATSAQGPLELNIPVCLGTADDGHGSIHHLAVRKTMQDLEEGRGWLYDAKTSGAEMAKTKYASRFDELVERESVRLGEKFQVAGKWTSFVAVQNGKEMEDKNVSTATDHSAPVLSNYPSGHSRGGLFGATSGGRGGMGSWYYDPFPHTSSSPHTVASAAANPIFGASPSSLPTTGFGGTACTASSTFGRPGHTSALFGSSTTTRGGLFGAAQPQAAFGKTADRIGGSVFRNTSHGTSSFGSLSNLTQSGRGLLGDGAHSGVGGHGNSIQAAGPPFGTHRPVPAQSSPVGDHQGSGGNLFGASNQPGFIPKDLSGALFGANSNLSGTGIPLPSSQACIDLTTGVAAEAVAMGQTAATASFEPTRPDMLIAESRTSTARYTSMDNDNSEDELQRTQAKLASVPLPAAALLERGEALDALRTTSFSARFVPALNAAPVHQNATCAIDPLHQIISLQMFSGSWTFSNTLNHLLNISASNTADISKNICGSTQADRDITATALVIAFLEIEMKDKKEVWEMIVKKAKAWLIWQLGSAENSQDVVKKAEFVVKEPRQKQT